MSNTVFFRPYFNGTHFSSMEGWIIDINGICIPLWKLYDVEHPNFKYGIISN